MVRISAGRFACNVISSPSLGCMTTDKLETGIRGLNGIISYNSLRKSCAEIPKVLLSAVRLKQLGRATSKHLPPGLSAGADQGAQSKLLRSKVRIVAEADTHTQKNLM